MVIHELLGRAMQPSFNEKLLAGLGRGLSDTRKLHPEGVELALAALGRFARIARAQACDMVIPFATAAVREALDGPDFVRRVRRETGLELRILGGVEEAKYSAQGVVAGSPGADGVVGDLGGSSLELAHVETGRFRSGSSYPLGPLTFDIETSFNEDKVLARARASLMDAPELRRGEALFHAVGGAWRSIAAVHMEVAKAPLHMLQNYEIGASDAVSFLKEIAGGKKHSALVQAVSKRRAATIPYAATVLRAVLEEGGFKSLLISSFGVREGIVFETVAQADRDEDPLEAGLAFFTDPDSPSGQFGRALAEWVAPVSTYLLPSRLTSAACRLADIGALLHPDHRADLAFELVVTAPLPGLSHKDRAALAQAVACRYKRGLASPIGEALLDGPMMTRARSLGALMRFGSEYSGRSADLLRTSSLQCDGKRLEFRVQSRDQGLISEAVERRLQQAAEELKMDYKLSA
jgi:exopolyphosphatase/guanosine-5'-triphosphate,3'-diphosphate pyrophosphatase